ncbi:E3 ubiquitin-protein ligase MIEL1-like [Pistacia vera]|uniref:E3 ubiquitin-protein ligase MIEL1-like n=1 Tax=Pistacia vera TaxID=55513 RepID=UPI0012638D4E|nr:E3 ubiquitin-protein ligase MIEL1-like [Pistacia vera]XP_031265717.1 E3 ubiquitin-protein ligase MIEL1-like [Pistacia vera]
MASSANERPAFGKIGYGCKHYRRRCKIRAPCCSEIFDHRHCHNEAASMLKNPYDRHRIVHQMLNRLFVLSVIQNNRSTFQLASTSEATVSTYEVSVWLSLWNDLFSQVFRAVKSILNGFVAFFMACNRHCLRISSKDCLVEPEIPTLRS